MFSEKVIVQENITEVLKEEKFDESNEKKRDKRQRDDNVDRVKDSYASFYYFRNHFVYSKFYDLLVFILLIRMM